MNRFLKRGIILLIAGIAFNIVGYVMKDRGLDHYGWPMVAGTVLFGLGFLFAFYSLFRKVEAQGLIEERAEEKERKARFDKEARKRKHAWMH
ncbi:hypothetical protein [Pedobacter sp. SYSU D00535]|uniref:hypothetical protein n=1 Tax=Pedobacter sp. SYSU D00535 TaxID=2810308 RepID=UPI001A96F401|nr:hypothetical protein [Pedobacter sp. SYSU D00535]